MANQTIIVCAPADADFAAVGSVFAHQCGGCGRRVMLAPSGQIFLKAHPEAALMCFHCYLLTDTEGAPHMLTASADQIASEVQSAIPNPWNKRN